jgi:hypothetical protein
MSDGIGTFDPFEDSSEYSIGGGNFGNPFANILFSGLVGHNYMPRPQGAQSMYDALIQRERSKHFMHLQGSMFSNNEVFKKLGVAGGKLGGMLGTLAGSPNGAMARLMSPVLGGNPMAAAMQTYAGFSGANVMGNFGRTTAISEGETEGVMQSLANNFYQSRNYEGPGGSKEKFQKDTRQFILDRVKQGPEGMNYLKSAGINLQTDKTGNLTEESSRKVDQYAKDITDENSTASRNLRNRMANKKVAAGDMLNELDKVLGEENEKKQKSMKEALVKRLEKEGKLAKEDLKSFAEGKGDKGAQTIRQRLEDLRDPSKDHFEKTYLEAMREKERGGSYQGMNLQNTRGFKLEDFTSGLYKASELRMLGDRKGQSVAMAMDDFSKHAGGAMSAARSLFGKDKSGSELVEAMSNLVGSSEVNLGDEKGAGQMEDLLRKVKSTARVAGISIKTMLGIVSSAKDLAANNPQLQHMNSAATTNIALSAVSKAANMGAAMSSKEYRALGGSQGISSREVVETNEFLGSNLGGGLSALLYSAKGNKNKAAFGKIQELIESGKVTGTYLEDKGFSEIANLLGTSEEDVRRTFMSDAMKKAASKDQETMTSVAKASDSSVMTSFFEGMSAESGGRDTEESLQKRFNEFTANGGTAEGFVASLDKDVSEGGKKLIEQYGGKMINHFINANRDPKQKAAVDEMIARQAEEEKKVAAEMDQYNAPAITNVIDKLAKADKIDLESVSDAMSTTFATKGLRYNFTKESYDKAAAAGTDIASITSAGKGQQAMLKEGLSGKLNVLARAMSYQAYEQGDMDKFNRLNQTSAEEEVSSVSEAQKDLGGVAKKTTFEHASKSLESLRARKAAGLKLTAREERSLEQLTGLENIGAMGDQSAYDKFGKGTAEEFVQARNDAELQNAAKVAGNLGGTAKGAKEMLADLREQEKSLSAQGKTLDKGSADRLRGLAYLENKGILEHESSWQKAQSGKLEGIAAGMLESHRATLVQEKTEGLKKTFAQNMGERLSQAATETNKGQLTDDANLSKDLLSAYSQYEQKDNQGKGTGQLTSEGYQKMLADYERPTKGSFFADEENKKRLANSGIGKILQDTQDSINNTQQSALAAGGGAPPVDQGNKALVDKMDELVKAISGGGAFTTALSDIANALFGYKTS